jgi:methyl-accepting chemotaxis protein
MQVKDLSISAKLTLATTSAMLAIFFTVSAGVLAITIQASGGIAEKTGSQQPDHNSFLKSVRSIESTGVLLSSLAAQAFGSSEGFTQADAGGLNEMIAIASKDPDIGYVVVTTANGETLAGNGVPASSPNFRRFPVLVGGEEKGRVEIGLTSSLTPVAATTPGTPADAGGSSQGAVIATIIALVLTGAVVTAMVIQYTIYKMTQRFINLPAGRIQFALSEMERRRDYSSRVEAEADDELGTTVESFNRALDFLDRQNNQLNDSVIDLLESAGKISTSRDLTIKVPVREDITGPLGDALNRLTKETSRVLGKVQLVAEQVATASRQVQEQGGRVVDVANREQELIEHTSKELSEAIKAIDSIAELAQLCNDAAQEAKTSTGEALNSVDDTVEGMGNIRETIQETGKRIKRLGERSQEISGIVDILNSFAERTHVLAINASMQAVNSGEAGKGFAVVAHEVQRLADSSRSATSQIADLIGNIQVETSDAIQTVNQAIETVTDQSRTVESAGEQMRLTQGKNDTLADSVQQIFARSQSQAAANSRLLEQIGSMRAGTTETTNQIAEQSEQTKRLAGFAEELLQSIRLFKLPELVTEPVSRDKT